MRDKTFVPREYDVFAGLDVDKKSIAATFSGHQGFIRSLSLVEGRALRASAVNIQKYLLIGPNLAYFAPLREL